MVQSSAEEHVGRAEPPRSRGPSGCADLQATGQDSPEGGSGWWCCCLWICQWNGFGAVRTGPIVFVNMVVCVWGYSSLSDWRNTTIPPANRALILQIFRFQWLFQPVWMKNPNHLNRSGSVVRPQKTTSTQWKRDTFTHKWKAKVLSLILLWKEPACLPAPLGSGRLRWAAVPNAGAKAACACQQLMSVSESGQENTRAWPAGGHSGSGKLLKQPRSRQRSARDVLLAS